MGWHLRGGPCGVTVEAEYRIMAAPADLNQLERDFLSGRNPLAYIPLCSGLRRQREYPRALDVCRRGLAADPDSTAGRTLLARLLSDIGRYEEALQEILRAEPRAPEAAGLATEKARALIHLGRLDEAREIIEVLRSRNLMGVDHQMLQDLLRQRERSGAQQSGTSGGSSDKVGIRRTSKEALALIVRELAALSSIRSAAIIPLDAGEPALEGNPVEAEVAYEHYRGIQGALKDSEQGTIKMSFIETAESQLIVLVRRRALVSLSFDPTPNFGKIYHRFPLIVAQHWPEATAR